MTLDSLTQKNLVPVLPHLTHDPSASQIDMRVLRVHLSDAV